MDHLLCYGSDDSEQSNDSETSFDQPQAPEKSECPDETEDEGSVNTTKSALKLENDFFSLGSSPKRQTVNSTKPASVKTADPGCRTFHTSEGALVEVPNSDFWADFTPPDSVARNESGIGYNEVSSHHSDYYQWQLGTAEDNQRPETEGSDSSSTSLQSKEISTYSKQRTKRQFENSEDNSPEGDGQLGKRHREPHSSDRNTHTPKLKKTLFCVHSKIAPYLMHSNVIASKCPKAVSKSWNSDMSTINRLNWNFGNFSHLLLSAGTDGVRGELNIWNPWSTVDPHAASLNVHSKSVKHAEWLRDGRAILSCSYDRTAQVTDVNTEKTLMMCDHVGYVTAGCCHPANPSLIFTGSEDLILMWDRRIADIPVRHFTIQKSFGQVQDLVVIQDGQELISCSDLIAKDSPDRIIMAWDVRSGAVLSNQIFQERYSCLRLKQHPDKQQFLAQSHGGYVALFSTIRPYKMDKTKRFGIHKTQGYNIGFDISPDGRNVYSGSAEGGIHCYDFTTGRLRTKLGCANQVIVDVACHPMLPSAVAASSWAGTISLWS